MFEGKESGAKMSRRTSLSVLMMIAAALLAVGLFIAGAMWRGRVSRGGGWTPKIQAALPEAIYLGADKQHPVDIRLQGRKAKIGPVKFSKPRNLSAIGFVRHRRVS